MQSWGGSGHVTRQVGGALQPASLGAAPAKRDAGVGKAALHAEQIVWPSAPRKGAAAATHPDGCGGKAPTWGDGKDDNDGGGLSTCNESPYSRRQGSRAGCALPVGRAGAVAATAPGPPAFTGPGPAESVQYDKLFRCFAAGNGLLFRLVDERHHTWAYYNDTASYTMHITVTFGRESSVEPLGVARRTVTDAASGRRRIDLLLPPGRTELFMRGEYNGFSSHYEVVPRHMALTLERNLNGGWEETGGKTM
ncbi:uncharacterized protein Tco025E_03873 [Trypanosoma conorhini]|uniref:DUF1935 domain-containing protein n=1 Tax=Trypanosoma conorhini TaxID=83891 RepID=A0A3R7NLH7_9TRYP|nr:uncharacterized protein Tco025E_03873 [Trypanosoma conorhini]RNF20128.1 hypothetical protein Tco025E_03873 [Trypanosoma conorhini]